MSKFETSGGRPKETKKPIRLAEGIRREPFLVSRQKFKSESNRIFRGIEEEKRPTIVTYRSGFAAIIEPLGNERTDEPEVVSLAKFLSESNRIFRGIEEEKRQTIVTYGSDLAAIVQPLAKEHARELAKESARDLITARTKSEQDLANGNTTLLSELAAELGIDVSDG